MRLNLVLFALLRQALCAQQAVDSAEIQSDLQSEHLNAWIESIAAKRQISKEAVRSNVRAVTYHLGPDSEDPGSAGGEHAKLERRGGPFADYPLVLGRENQNDQMTISRITEYHIECRRRLMSPPNSPFTPNHNLHSFWRAAGGTCDGKTIQISCLLPNQFGPSGWNQKSGYALPMPCGADQDCTPFLAHNFSDDQPATWASCTSIRQTDNTEWVNDYSQSYFTKYPCPMAPATGRHWDLYGEALDGKEIDWTVFSGVPRARLFTSRSPTFMFGNRVQWTGTKAARQPWLKFARIGTPAKIRLYSHVA